MRSLRFLLATLTLTGALVTAAGCSPAAAPPAPAPTASTEQGRGPDDLARARARWAAAGLDSYRYALTRSCFCPPEFSGPFDVTVSDGAVTSTLRQGQPLGSDMPAPPTVEALFDLLAEAYATGADEVRVQYDARLGYPTEVYVNPEFQAADEEMGYTVTALTAE